MSRFTEIFNYLRTCPKLAESWGIGGTEEKGVNVIFPQGTSPVYQYVESTDITGDYNCDIVPHLSVYEDYQVNCYQAYDASDNTAPQVNLNILSYDEVVEVCEWIAEQNENGNLPAITGKQVVSIECNPFIPQIRGINQQRNLICYFITVRIRYVNTAKRKLVVHGDTD